MSTKKSTMKEKLENMQLRERINYGYKKVIIMMLISGLFSIIVIGVLFANMYHYVENVSAADQAVKMCRVNVNAAARNIREMALNNDTSSYNDYELTVEKLLTDVDSQLQIIKKSGVVSEADYNEYASYLSQWGNIGYSIIENIKSGNKDKATEEILNKCTPALNKLVEKARSLGDITDKASNKAAITTLIFAAAGIVCIIVCLSTAWILAKRTSKKVLETIIAPLKSVENTADEMMKGNLHSTLDYKSDDELGRLAHSLRNSIAILGSYVDDIDRAMKLFAEGNFDVKPEVEWKGDFVGILNSFMLFEESMAETIKGIQRVSDEVSSAAEQVASSSNELADGATNQAAVVEELTATVAGVAEQVEKNSQSAKQISSRVGNLGEAISESNSKMQEMVASMNKDAILFAMANPVPEIMPDLAKAAGAKVVGTGRSDFPNQVNNVVAFPGIFKGALEGRAPQITEEMKLATAKAIAGLVPDEELNEDNILPEAFDPRVSQVVSEAVKALI